MLIKVTYFFNYLLETNGIGDKKSATCLITRFQIRSFAGLARSFSHGDVSMMLWTKLQ